MPKRSYMTSYDMPMDPNAPPLKIQKTERSHEENQERAYIAASRRADRSLEARVQSARMASDIHRKRTGRGLKVSEEIVLKEEMYEEMEDDVPRAYRLLTQHLQTNSPELNHRVHAYVASQTALATMAKYNEIDRRFSEAFPRALSFSREPNTLYPSPVSPVLSHHHRHSAPSIPTTATTPQINRNHSTSTQSTILETTSVPTPTTASVSTPDLSPGTTMEPLELASPPYQVPQSPFPDLPLDPQLTQLPKSNFTSELPMEAKTMGNFDVNDPMYPHLYGKNASPAFCMMSQYQVDPMSACQAVPGDWNNTGCSSESNQITSPPLDTPTGQPEYLMHYGGAPEWEMDNFFNFENEQ